MKLVRTFGAIAMTAALAACSGNLGGGQSTLPGTPQGGSSNIQQVAQAAPTPTPNSASDVATYGVGGPQPLPTINGWGGSIAFANAAITATGSPDPKATPPPPGANTVSVGLTSSIVEPADSPRFNPAGRHRARAGSPTGLFFITLLATADIELDALPQIAVYVPRDLAAKYRGDTFGLALYDPDTKSKAYRLDVAQRDFSAPQSGSLPSPLPATPVPSPTPTAQPFPLPGMTGAFTPPPISTPTPAPHSLLPPAEIAFIAAPAKLTLHENQPVFFALYVVAPVASPAPSPSASPKRPAASPSPSPSPSASPSPGAAVSALPSPAPTPTR
jgi:hypothetical protein